MYKGKPGGEEVVPHKLFKVKFMTLWNDFCPVSVIRQRDDEMSKDFRK
jgi:hypothetical protein